MKLRRREFLQLAAGAAALPAISRYAWAQTYPSRPVRFIIGIAPGSSPDILGRLMAESLSERLGLRVIHAGSGLSASGSLQTMNSGGQVAMGH